MNIDWLKTQCNAKEKWHHPCLDRFPVSLAFTMLFMLSASTLKIATLGKFQVQTSRHSAAQCWITLSLAWKTNEKSTSATSCSVPVQPIQRRESFIKIYCDVRLAACAKLIFSLETHQHNVKYHLMAPLPLQWFMCFATLWWSYGKSGQIHMLIRLGICTIWIICVDPEHHLSVEGLPQNAEHVALYVTDFQKLLCILWNHWQVRVQYNL